MAALWVSTRRCGWGRLHGQPREEGNEGSLVLREIFAARARVPDAPQLQPGRYPAL